MAKSLPAVKKSDFAERDGNIKLICVFSKGSGRNAAVKSWNLSFSQPIWIREYTDYGLAIRKWPAEHGRELQPKFLVKTEAYLSATFGPKILDIFDLCLHWASIVCERVHKEELLFNSESVSVVKWKLLFQVDFALAVYYLEGELKPRESKQTEGSHFDTSIKVSVTWYQVHHTKIVLCTNQTCSHFSKSLFITSHLSK